MQPAGTVNRNKNWNKTPTDLALFSVSILLAPTLLLFVIVLMALGNDRHRHCECSSPSPFRVSFPGWEEGWQNQHSVPSPLPRQRSVVHGKFHTKSQVGIIRESHEKSGWRCTILLTSILHSMSILYHCSLYNFVSYSKGGKLLSMRVNWYYILHCLFPPC